jgi:L-threonylcarbamoyladenylate synthase
LKRASGAVREQAEDGPMNLLPATPPNIARAAGVLRNGGVVAFPTETVYGLGANAFDARAAARIFEIKQRPRFDPLIVHVLDRAMLMHVVAEVPDVAEKLIERFWPGALTLVLCKRPSIPDLVTAGSATVAVRMPSHPIARALLATAELPLAAPSANPFGYLSPTRALHVERLLGESVDLILDGGPSEHGLESTIVALEPRPALMRSGAVDVESIEAEIGALARGLPGRPVTVAPGQAGQHYAPHTPLRLIDLHGVPAEERARAGALAFRAPVEGYVAMAVLSPSGDLREAAARLFETLHDLDSRGLERIDVDPVPERGLGLAIMDRLRRAAGR